MDLEDPGINQNTSEKEQLHGNVSPLPPPQQPDFLCGWLNVWALDGSRPPANELFSDAAPQPYYPDWEPLFVVFSYKTGQLSHFLTEQYAEEFYRFTDNVSLFSSIKKSSVTAEIAVSSSDPEGLDSLRPAITRRLDDGRSSFMARWGYESLENLHSRFGKAKHGSRNALLLLEKQLFDLNNNNSSANANNDYDDDASYLYYNDSELEDITSSSFGFQQEQLRRTIAGVDDLKSPPADSSHTAHFFINSPVIGATSTAQKDRPSSRTSVLRRDISISMDVLNLAAEPASATKKSNASAAKTHNTSSHFESGSKTLTFGKTSFFSSPKTSNAEQPHVRRPSFRSFKAFLNQHSRNSSSQQQPETDAPTSSGWHPFSGLKIRRAKSQAKLQQQQQQTQLHCISSSLANFQGQNQPPSTPDRWRPQPSSESAPYIQLEQNSRPSSSLFGSQLTMTTIDLNDPDMVQIRPVHPTLLNGHCFQINSMQNPQTHFYACKTPAEGRAWLWELSNYSLASMPYNNQGHSPSPLNPSRTSDSALMKQSQTSSQLRYPQPGRTRMVNTLKLSVLEAVNLPQKYKYYCDIYIDEILYARTTSKHRHELLFWGENFEFNTLPAVQFVMLKLYRETPATSKKAQKNSLLGSVQVPIADISGRQLIDRWYPISVESKIRRRIFGQRNSTVVNIRIRGRYQSTVVLPQPNYRDLINFSALNYSWLVETLEPAIPLRLKEELASCLVHILQARGQAVNFLVSAALAEVQRSSSDNEALAFRGNSIASKAFECYMKLVGERYLFDLLSGFVQAVGRSCEDCEVDPAKLNASCTDNSSQNAQNQSRNLDRNRFNLVSYCEMVWRKVLQSAQWFPPELRAVFAEIREQLKSKPALCDNMISACIFLRFLCPAILSPSLFGLCQEYPEERASRTFTLVAKTVQTLANFARFGIKEEYMTFMNSFVEREQSNVRQFLLQISSKQSSENQNSGLGGPFIDTAYHSSLLHDVLCECIAFLPKLTASRGDRHDSPRTDENDITRHLELQAVLDRLTEDLGTSSMQSLGQPAANQTSINYAAHTQTLPISGRPHIPSIVAYDNLVVYPQSNATNPNPNFNTFPHKPNHGSTSSATPAQPSVQFVQPATVITNHRKSSVGNAVPQVTTTAEGVTVSVLTTGPAQQKQQPGSSFTLSPSLKRHSQLGQPGCSKTLNSTERRQHSPWQNVNPSPNQQQTQYRSNTLSKLQSTPSGGKGLSDSPERELEKSWNQLMAAAEMLSVDSAAAMMQPSSSSNQSGSPAKALSSRVLKQQPKMGLGVHHSLDATNSHSPTTRFSTLTSGYQSSSLSSSNSNSPTQTQEGYSVSKKTKPQKLRNQTVVCDAAPDYSIISAHDHLPSTSSKLSHGSSRPSIVETSQGPMINVHLNHQSPQSTGLEDSANLDEVFAHNHHSSHSPLINSMEMNRLIGACVNEFPSGQNSSPTKSNPSGTIGDLLMVRSNGASAVTLTGSSNKAKRSSSGSSSGSSYHYEDMTKSMFEQPSRLRRSRGQSEGSNCDSATSNPEHEVSTVLDNLVHLEQELKQEHAALIKSSADRQWLLENGQRCVGSLLDALTKLRKHCEQITQLDQSLLAAPTVAIEVTSPNITSGQQTAAINLPSPVVASPPRKESHI